MVTRLPQLLPKILALYYRCFRSPPLKLLILLLVLPTRYHLLLNYRNPPPDYSPTQYRKKVLLRKHGQEHQSPYHQTLLRLRLNLIHPKALGFLHLVLEDLRLPRQCKT